METVVDVVDDREGYTPSWRQPARTVDAEDTAGMEKMAPDAATATAAALVDKRGDDIDVPFI